MPENYGAALPRFEQMPQALQDIIVELRTTVTGQFVTEFYGSDTRQTKVF